MYYDYQRWYDPSLGRFISQDSLGGDLSSTQGLNLYVYVRNSPTSRIDPTGLTDEGDVHTCSEDQSCGQTTLLDFNGDPVELRGGDVRGFNPEAGQYNPSSYEISGGIVEPSATSWTQTTLDESATTVATTDLVDTSNFFNQLSGGQTSPFSNPASTAGGYRFVSTPSGTVVSVPGDWSFRLADNGRGSVYQQPGATGNSNMIRIMDPTIDYPRGYVVYYNDEGQPLDVFGSPGNPAGRSATHIPLDYVGPIPGWR